MRRDWRLVLAFFFLVVGCALSLVMYQTSVDWAIAFGSGDWTEFGRKYSVNVTDVMKPNCFDCQPFNTNRWADLGPVFLALAAAIVAYAWWKPKV